MHISDGVLTTPIVVGSYLTTFSLLGYTSKKMKPEDIPKTAVMSSCFFVSSLLHVPVGPMSVHLTFTGLIGILLGRGAFVAVFLAIVLQGILFQHGGLTTIGVNTLIMGVPAILSYKLFNLHRKFHLRFTEAFFGAVAGGSAVVVSAIILSLFLAAGGEALGKVAQYALIAHLPLVAVEGVMTAGVVAFLVKVKPELLH
jgi:cobalt/nickel transport system permease protein